MTRAEEFDRWTTLVGQRVRVTLQQHPEVVIAEGRLLSLEDSGQAVVQDDMGFAHYCWPALDVEVCEACDNCGQGAPGYLVVGDRRFCHPDYSQPCQVSNAK